MRVRGRRQDLIFGGWYSPTRSTFRLAGYTECVDGLVRFFDDILAEAPGRCVPVLGGDLNDGLGRTVVDGMEVDVESTAVGDARRGREGLAGRRVRSLLERYEFLNFDESDWLTEPRRLSITRCLYTLSWFKEVTCLLQRARSFVGFS